MNDDSSESSKLFEEIKQVAQLGLQLPRRSMHAGNRPVPGYELQEEIHRGGQGVVFRAIQESTRRTVALKLILLGSYATERQRFRFEREIELASRLNHPNIVMVFDGGIANNQPYYAMEFVDGRPLNQVNWTAHAMGKPTRRVVELFQKICEAVGYAHARGVVHRDLKPANILVDPAGEPHVLDFGLAKLLNEEEPNRFSPHTITGEFVGTLAYASPEQAQASSELTDTRSDVYSLGVVFYEMLTGKMPYDVSGSLFDILGNIATAEPRPFSTDQFHLDSDIETILRKSLAKEADRRYPNASLLAEDLRHYLCGEPIQARRDSSWYVLKKLMVRNKRTVFAAASSIALLLAALVLTSWSYFQAVRERNIADRARLDEQEQRQIAQRESAEAQQARAKEVTAREDAEFRNYVAHMSASESSIRMFDVEDALRNLSSAPVKHRGFDWWYLLGQIDLSKSSLGGWNAMGELPFMGDYRSVDYSPDGKWIAAGNAAGMVYLWDTATRKIVAHWDGGSAVQRLRFHPNSSQIAVGLSIGDATLVEVRADPEKTVQLRSVDIHYPTDRLRLHALEFSPDGASLVLGCGTYPTPGKVLVYETDTGKLLKTLTGHDSPVWSVAVSRDGQLIASADNEISIWSFETGERLRELPGHANWVWDLAFHPDSGQLASCALEQEVRIWDVGTGERTRTLAGHTSFVNALEYSEDGRQLVTVSEDRTIRSWETDGYTASGLQWGHLGGIVDVAIGPDGQVATAGSLCVKIWEVQKECESIIANASLGRITSIDINPDSKRVLVSDDRGVVIEWNLETCARDRINMRQLQSKAAVGSVAYSPNSEFAAWSNHDSKIHVFQFGNRQTEVLDEAAGVNAMAISSDGKVIYSACDDKTVRRWNVQDKTAELFCNSEWQIRNVVVSPNGLWLATSDIRGISLWEIASGKLVADIPVPRGNAREFIKLAFHPNGTQIAATLPPHEAAVWSIPDGREVQRLSENIQNIQSLAWSPDGKRLAIASRNGLIKIWDSQRFQVVLTLRGFSGYCEAIEFSPDNLRLVGGMYDNSIRMWNSLPPERRGRTRHE